ncbi:hypothetical protein Bca4012_097387 [Brassica carinata]
MPSPPSSLREKSDRNPRGATTLSVVAAAPPRSLVFSLRTTIETDKGSDSVGNSRRLLRYLVFTVRRGQHDLDADYLNEDNKEHLSALALSLPDIMVTL